MTYKIGTDVLNKQVSLTTPSTHLKLIGIKLPIIETRSNLSKIISDSIKIQTTLKNNDIIIITSKIVSRANGLVVDLNTVTPSEQAKQLSKIVDKDPRYIEVVLQNSTHIVKAEKGKLITRHKSGLIASNAGIDHSNVPGGENYVVLLPDDPNYEAFKLRKEISKLTKKNIAVVITDTHGRVLRHGDVNVAIGVSGIKAVKDQRGLIDLFGRTLRIKHTAIADEIAGAGELITGGAGEGIPVVILRGYTYPTKLRNGKELQRSPEKIFHLPPKERWIKVS